MASMDQHAEKLLELVLPLAAKKALELGFDKVTAVLSKVRASLSTPQYEIEKALDDHQREILRWADEVSFSDTTLGRRLSDVFVPLNVYLSRRRNRFDDSDLAEMSLEDALAFDKSSCIVLGQPGAGKTTAVKHLCQRFFADTDYLSSFQVLIRIELRQMNLASATQVPEFIRRSLQEMLHLRISYPDELAGDDNASARRALRDSAVLDWLNTVHALIVLDGFDEITHKARRDLVVEELRKLAIQLTNAAFFLTTRTGEFSAHIERTRTLEVKPFSKSQIAKFASNWLGSPDDQKFITQLEQSPYHDTAIRPLTLAHLCVIFEKSKRIPAKPKTIYRRIVRLLLEDWDEQRSVVRESSYADFAADRKEEFLANLAYELTRLFKTSTFGRDELLRCYASIHGNFGLPADQATKVVDELETHTGLVLQSGRDQFEFSHKSLQEFLAASYIALLPSIPNNMIELQIMPNELALATALSSKPSEYLTQLVAEHFSRVRTSFQFTRSFVNRLLLESPDFEASTRVGYALLVLYSQYLRSVVISQEQMSLFLLDQLGKEFAILGQKIKQRITFDELDEIYDKAESGYTFEGDPVWHLTRRKKKVQQKLRRSELSFLPDEIYIRDTLLAGKDPEAGEPPALASELGNVPTI